MDQTKQGAAEALEQTRQKVAGQTTTDKAKDTLHQGEAKMGMGEPSYTDRAKQAFQDTREKASNIMEQGKEKASNLMEQGKEKFGMGGERR